MFYGQKDFYKFIAPTKWFGKIVSKDSDMNLEEILGQQSEGDHTPTPLTTYGNNDITKNAINATFGNIGNNETDDNTKDINNTMKLDKKDRLIKEY